MQRNVKVVSNIGGSSREAIKTDVTKWKDLQVLLNGKGFKSDNSVKAIVRETKNELSLPDSELPQGDFTLFLVPAKVKSGSVARVDVYSDKTEDELRNICGLRGITVNGDKYALRKKLRGYDKRNSVVNNTAATPAPAPSVVEEEKSLVDCGVGSGCTQTSGLTEDCCSSDADEVTEKVEKIFEEAKIAMIEVIKEALLKKNLKAVMEVFEGLEEECAEIAEAVKA